MGWLVPAGVLVDYYGGSFPQERGIADIKFQILYPHFPYERRVPIPEDRSCRDASIEGRWYGLSFTNALLSFELARRATRDRLSRYIHCIINIIIKINLGRAR